MAKSKLSRKTYQQGGNAAPATSRRVIGRQVQKANPSGAVGRPGNAPLPRQHPIHDSYR